MRPRQRFVRHLNPYVALILVAVPLAIVEPAKLVALFIFGKGHWVTGSVVMVLAYACSLFFVDRLFKMMKPNLLRLPCFRAIWQQVVLAAAKMRRWWRNRSQREVNRS